MAFGKWSMYFGAVIFLVIGVGALVAGLTVEDEVAGVDTGLQTTCWILAATFIPGAVLFVFVGRWFKSMAPSFDSMMQTSAQMSRNASAMYQQYGQGRGVVTGAGVITSVGGGVVTGGSPLPTGQPPVPAFNDPMAQPPPG
jgi:Na+-driven multidrug efflux pump